MTDLQCYFPVKIFRLVVSNQAAMVDLVRLFISYRHHLSEEPIGWLGGPEGLRSLTNPKAVIVDRFPWLIQTSIPKQLDYPIRSLATAWLVSCLILLLYLTC